MTTCIIELTASQVNRFAWHLTGIVGHGSSRPGGDFIPALSAGQTGRFRPDSLFAFRARASTLTPKASTPPPATNAKPASAIKRPIPLSNACKNQRSNLSSPSGWPRRSRRRKNWCAVEPQSLRHGRRLPPLHHSRRSSHRAASRPRA